MANLPKTKIGTSDPIDICKGFDLFKSDTRAPDLGFESGKTLLSISPKILFWKFLASAGYSFSMGECGPGYAVLFDAEGETDGNQVQLTISNDETAAGFALGLSIGLFVNFAVEKLKVKWTLKGGFVHEWEKTFSTKLSITFDLIDIIATYINRVLEEDGQEDTLFQKIADHLPGVETSWGMYDYRQNQFAANNGTLKVDPGFHIPINIVPLTEDLGPPLDLAYAVEEALHALWGGFQMGPQITISIPVQVNLTEIKVDDQTYSNLQFNGAQVTGTGGQATDNPQNIGVGLKETPGLDITLGVFVDVYVLKLFNLSASRPLADIASLLGIDVKFGPFSDSLSSALGGGPAGTGVAFLDEGGEISPSAIEVVLEPDGMNG